MNLLLLEPDELGPDGHVALLGRRAQHIRRVLRAEPGQTLRCGVLDGALGHAVVESLDAEGGVRLQVTLESPPTRPTDVLLLAFARPKVTQRMLAHAAALGFGTIVLFRSWRVDKSWLHSTSLAPATVREQLMLGLEQAGRTHLPRVHRFELFKPMVEDSLPELGLPEQRFVAHPAAAQRTHALTLAPKQSFALAIGPDGGFLRYEVEQLGVAGFAPVSCGSQPLRTETALAALWGQLDLLRAMA